jgi:hypothetical protein
VTHPSDTDTVPSRSGDGPPAAAAAAEEEEEWPLRPVSALRPPPSLPCTSQRATWPDFVPTASTETTTEEEEAAEAAAEEAEEEEAAEEAEEEGRRSGGDHAVAAQGEFERNILKPSFYTLQDQGLKPGDFMQWVKLDSACIAPPRGYQRRNGVGATESHARTGGGPPPPITPTASAAQSQLDPAAHFQPPSAAADAAALALAGRLRPFPQGFVLLLLLLLLLFFIIVVLVIVVLVIFFLHLNVLVVVVLFLQFIIDFNV